MMNPVVRWSLGAGFLALLLGWWLATPASSALQFDDSASAGLPDVPPRSSTAQNEAALQTLYERGAWSAKPPEPEEGEGGQAGEASAQLTGLNRFTLVGFIRQGSEPVEVLLLDAQGGEDDKSPSLRVSTGQTLADSDVTLTAIEGTRVQLTMGERSRWVALFGAPEANEQTPSSD